VDTLQPARGTKDLLGEDHRRHSHVVDTARRTAMLYGFEEWSTPIFEDTRVFARTLGDTSDVVTKEMYSFQDRGGESLTLRPENTAGICRALVTGGLTQSLPQKVFQIGAELIGAPEPLADAEIIALGWDILTALGVADGVVLELNTLGDTPSRDAYRAALIAYFSAHTADLSADSQARLERNPLRILDSKDAGDRALIDQAPVIDSYLTEDAAKFYEAVQAHLTRFGVPFMKNPRIVRGLDYYSHTAFEFVTTRLGAQGTVMAGGRYDGLVAEMGGPPTPAVGWAAGIERLSMLLAETPAAPRPVAVIPMGEAAESAGLTLLQALRRAGIRAEIAYRGNFKRRMERANRISARAAIILGDDEIARGVGAVKDLATGVQTEITLADIPRVLAI
jgi:histidyl-tRNA synthetase